MLDAWRLAKDLVLRPSRAAERLKAPQGLPDSLRIFAVFLVVSVIYYSWKPMNFPFDAESGSLYGTFTGDVRKGPLFWLRVQAWSPILAAIWAVFLAWFARLLRSGAGGPPRLILAIALGVAPLVPLALYRSHVLPGWAFAGLWLAALAAMTPWLKARPQASWRALVSLTLGISAVNLTLCPFYSAAVVLRWAWGYHALEIVMLVWTLGLSSYLAGRLEDMRTARAFVAVFASMLWQMWVVFSLYLLGAVPKDVLQALMSV